MRIYIWNLLPTACVHPTLGNDEKVSLIALVRILHNLCTNPCLPFTDLLTAGFFHFNRGSRVAVATWADRTICLIVKASTINVALSVLRIHVISQKLTDTEFHINARNYND